jgi:PAS domain S-box-containing protein
MKRILILLAFLTTFLYANKSVLIINSYHKGYAFSDSIVNAIENEFYKNSTIDTNILYMDSKRITSKEYFTNLTNLYSVQLKNRKYDLVITVDRFAYDFILDNYDNFFKDTPVLTVGIENFSKQNALNHGLKNVSALLEKRDLLGNISLIEKAIPTLKTIYIINDKSLNAQHTEPLIQEALKLHNKDYKLEYYRANNLEELEKKFSKIKKDEAVLFVRFYKNKDGYLNKNQKISKFINSLKLPVFVTDSIFMGKGSFGGRIVDLNKFGVKSSKIAFDILEGEKYQISIFKDLTYVFDEQKIKQFFIFPISLVKDFEIINKSLTFYEKNKGFITFVFIISPLLLFLVLGLGYNIYLRKKTEIDLRQRIEFDSILLNAIESPIFWQDANGVIVDSNSEFCGLLQLKCSEIYGKTFNDFPDNKSVRKVIKVLKKYNENQFANHEFKFYDKNQKKKIYIIKQAKYLDKKSKREGIVTIFTDVTEQKAIEIEKQRDKQFVIQQSKLAEIGEVFSSIAHQWKSPLVEITAIAQELFYTRKVVNEKEDSSFVSDIMTQVDYMTDTINDFQTFIMPSHSKTMFDIYDAIESMLAIINHNMKYNNIKINIEIQNNCCLIIYGYKNEFMQCFLNIINNAKDELLKNDYKNRKIDIKLFNKDENLIIMIEDNAGGIDSKNLGKIFNPYYSTKDEGHGIGLYMSKMIIEDKMDGKIIASNIDGGACFKIELGCSCENISS